MILDRCLPSYHFNEVHSIAIEAPRERVYQAIKQVKLSEIAFASLLFRIRGLAAPASAKSAEEPSMLENMFEKGFSALADEENREVVFGSLSQPWKLTGGKTTVVRGADAFIRFQDHQIAKIAANFFIEEMSGPKVKLTTETRIFIADERSRRRFAAYWAVIYPGSSLLRRMWLRAIKRKASC